MLFEDEIDILYKRATYGTLSNQFTDWHLKNEDGVTVAHVAAKFNNLPARFNIAFPEVWEMKDNFGKTVAEVALENGYKI